MAKKSTSTQQHNPVFDYIYIITWAIMPLVFLVYEKQVQDAGYFPRLALLGLSALLATLILFTKKTKPFPFIITIAAISLFVLWHFAGYSTALIKSEFWATFGRNAFFLGYILLTFQLLRNGLLKFSALVYGGVLFGAISALSILPDWSNHLAGKKGFEDIYAVQGLFSHKNLAASALLLSVPFLYLGSRMHNTFWKYLSLGTLGLAVLEIAFLRTRGVWIGFAGGVAVTVLLQLLSKQKDNQQLKYIGLGTGIFAILIASFFLVGNNAEKVLNRSNIDTRLFYWNSSIEMAKEHPVTGIGAGNWKVNFPKYGLRGTNQSVMEGQTNIIRPHNDMLWVLSEMGIPAWIALAAFQLLLLFIGVKLLNHTDGEKRNYAMASIFGLIAFALYGLGEFPIERPVVVGLLVLLVAEALRLAEEEEILKKPLFMLQPKVLNSAILLLAFLGFWIASHRIRGERNAAKAVDAYLSKNPVGMLNFGTAAQNNFFDVDIYNTPMLYFTGLGHLAKQQLPQAESDFKEALRLSPYHMNTIKQLGDVYKFQRKYDLALAQYDQALEISPRFYMAALGKAEIYFQQKNIRAALGALNLVSHTVTYQKYQQLGTAILVEFGKIEQPTYLTDLHTIIQQNSNSPAQLWEAYLNWKRKSVSKKD